MLTKRGAIFLAIGLTCGILSSTSTAVKANTGQINLVSGSLSLFGLPTTLTANAAIQAQDFDISSSIPFVVKDGTGSGAGWRVNMTSTNFVSATNSAHTLPADATSINNAAGVTYSCYNSFVCTIPTNSVTYPLGIPAGSTAPTAVTIFNSATNTGMGDISINIPINTHIPGSVYAETYVSTWSITVSSGP